MSVKWKDRLVSAIIGGLMMFIPTMIATSINNNYDEEMTWREKVQDIDLKKANIQYVDIKCNETKEQILRENNLILKNIAVLQNDVKQILKEMPKQ